MPSREFLVTVEQAYQLAVAEVGLVKLEDRRALHRDGVARLMFRQDPESPFARAQALFSSDPSFKVFVGGYWSGPDGSSMICQPHTFVWWLLNQRADKENINDAIGKLQQVAETNSTTMCLVAAVQGIALDHPCALTDDITLTPFANLPPTYYKPFFLGQTNTLGPNPFVMSPATAALVLRFEHSPLVVPSIDSRLVGSTLEEVLAADALRSGRLADACRVASLIGPNSARILGRAYMPDDRDLATLMTTGFRYDYSVRADPPVGPFDPKAAIPLVRRFMSLPEAIRVPLRRSIDRLSQAQRQRALEDRAIDLGICLESVLMHDTADSGDNNPISYRLALRGALFLENDPAEQKRRYDQLRAVYAIRSAAVHTGDLTSANRLIRRYGPLHAALGEGMTAAAKILRALIDRGEWPDWERNVIFRLPEEGG